MIMCPSAHSLSLLYLAFVITSPVNGALTNRTIDDTDASYFTFLEDPNSPDSRPWTQITPSTPCLFCSAQPQTTNIYNKTWHDGGNNSAGSFTFQGADVYIYGIDLDNPANISFTMDDITAFHYYAGSEQFVFNSLFFEAKKLTPNVNHTVSWVLHESKSNGTTGLFDYAIITVDDSSSGSPSGSVAPTQSSTPSSSKSKSNTGAIAGGVVGGVAALALIAALAFFLRRRRATQAQVPDGPEVSESRPRRVREDYVVQPFLEPAPSSGGDTSPATSAPESKMLDVSWNNPRQSVPSVVPQPEPTMREPDVLSHTTSQPDTSTMAPSSRERFLEDRLATLEAQVNQHLPPPYAQPPE
ncbi:hypothetical protein B0H10DRAFT_2122634 [Mycena sp. CBHHK59/15]|nr:hypothetical protein B0H10DRAFT_2122634 [Mycena sp. CBHHK59/15]